MANWPPVPQNDNSNNPPNQLNNNQLNDKQWQVIENTMLAGITEQRRARRWGIFFKIITFIYILVIVALLGKGCVSEPTQSANFSEPHIAVVDVLGVIADGGEVNSKSINKTLSDAFINEMSKAVVLNINSPGGSPVQSDEIWRHIRKLKKQFKDKKIYAYIGDIGASGAYYIASAADEIWVNNSSIVGSIGVIMPNIDVQGLAKKVGIKDRTLTAGEHKNILSINKSINTYEQKHVQAMLDNVHLHFINAVKEGRGNRLKNIKQNKTFSGLFWSGAQAISIGLADKSGSITDIADMYKNKNIINYTPTDPMQELLKNMSMSIGQGVGTVIEQKILATPSIQ